MSFINELIFFFSFVNEIDYVHLLCNNKLDDDLTTKLLDFGVFYNMLNVSYFYIQSHI